MRSELDESYISYRIPPHAEGFFLGVSAGIWISVMESG
jgi:hypothetical protein